MKRTLIFFMTTLFCLSSMAQTDTGETDGKFCFHINTPGTLADSIPNADKSKVAALILSGIINGDDITYIKDLPNLKDLDIEKATIKYETGKIVTEESALMQFDFNVCPDEPWADNEKIDGVYYLKNLESGLYLTAGNSWGTRSTLGIHGLDLTITQLENGKYTIDTNISRSTTEHYFGANAFMDTDMAEWTITEIAEGVYTLSIIKPDELTGVSVEKYIGYDRTSTEVSFELTADAVAAQWVFVTEGNFRAEMINATKTSPVDATFLISGQGFNHWDDNRNAAWQGTPQLGGDYPNYCAEKYNCTFDVYQTLRGIPNGIYEVSVQGFYRNGFNNVASVAHNGGTETLNAMLYANEETTPLMSIFAESKEAKEGGWSTSTEAGFVPNTMRDASDVFTAV